MAIPNPELINALRATVRKLSSSDNYQWGHMGSCNCGHLAQELTNFSKAEIHAFAMERYGDWSQQTKDFCPDSKLTIDLILQTMFNAGLSKSDIRHLEKLSDNKIVNSLPENSPFSISKLRSLSTALLSWKTVTSLALTIGSDVNGILCNHPVIYFFMIS